MIFPPVYSLCIAFLGLLAMTTSLPDNDDNDIEATINVKATEVKTKWIKPEKKGNLLYQYIDCDRAAPPRVITSSVRNDFL
ncbi:hypothetical protein [Cyanobacterium aponinum]|uniref:Uncharacterized protein n=1 Tax=Cyanobacterium aponinum 0216 TaxID=2676140 RepID=A0A844GR15_9CHRO|nr:hypothetical protein [Cyanobacterium aponinum]MTF37492.1 hypothetical protein [Cyanobacterium aponinum 0216]